MVSNDTQTMMNLYRKLDAQRNYDEANGYGPTLMIIIGILLTTVVFGIILVIIGIFWSLSNRDKRNDAKAELEMLEKIEAAGFNVYE